MPKPIRISIEPDKFDKRYAKTYTDPKTGRVRRFYQMVAWENRDGRDKFGNTHSIKQDLPSEMKDSGVDPKDLPYVGNLNVPSEDSGGGGRQQRRPAPSGGGGGGRYEQRATRRDAPPLRPDSDGSDWANG